MSEKKTTTGCSPYRIPEGFMIYALLSNESFVMTHTISETTITLNSFQIFIYLDRILNNGIGIITLFVK